MFERLIRRKVGYPLFALAVSLVLFSVPVSANPQEDQVQKPAWVDKLEKQIDYEEMMSGLQGRREKVEKNFNSLMLQYKQKLKEHATPASSGGGYHDSWAAHQMGQSYLLGPEEVAAKSNNGAHCPSGVPVKSYDISAINVEITLNQWGDYYPGYMFVLTKNIDQVRKDEKINAEARKI